MSTGSATKNRKKKPIKIKRKKFKKSRKWAMDYDYLPKLKMQLESDNPEKVKEAEEALLFLNKFNDEYYSASGYKKKDSLHRTKQQRKSCSDKHNEARRDIATYWRREEGPADSNNIPEKVLRYLSVQQNEGRIDALNSLLDLKIKKEKEMENKKINEYMKNSDSMIKNLSKIEKKLVSMDKKLKKVESLIKRSEAFLNETKKVG